VDVAMDAETNIQSKTDSKMFHDTHRLNRRTKHKKEKIKHTRIIHRFPAATALNSAPLRDFQLLFGILSMD